MVPALTSAPSLPPPISRPAARSPEMVICAPCSLLSTALSPMLAALSALKPVVAIVPKLRTMLSVSATIPMAPLPVETT